MEKTLSSLKIVVPETRLLEVLAKALEKRGADVQRCPLVSIYDSPKHLDVLQWLERMAAGEFDLVLWYTGEGLRRIQNILREHAPEQLDALPNLLGRQRNLVRGPKPVKELIKLGVQPDITAIAPTTDGIIETLQAQNLNGQTVALQLYGSYDNPPLQDFLRDKGAKVDTVAPYIYADESETEQVAALIEQLIGAELNAACFTSMSQVKRLYAVAKKHGQITELTTALNALMVIAVGPVVRDSLLDKGVSVAVMPEDSYFIKPMIRAVEAALEKQAI